MNGAYLVNDDDTEWFGDDDGEENLNETKQAKERKYNEGDEGNENCWCRKMNENKNCWVYSVRKEKMEGVGF